MPFCKSDATEEICKEQAHCLPQQDDVSALTHSRQRLEQRDSDAPLQCVQGLQTELRIRFTRLVKFSSMRTLLVAQNNLQNLVLRRRMYGTKYYSPWNED